VGRQGWRRRRKDGDRGRMRTRKIIQNKGGKKSLLSLLSFYSQDNLQFYELVIVSNEVVKLVTLPYLNSGAASIQH
jgi:hypothetical protein